MVKHGCKSFGGSRQSNTDRQKQSTHDRTFNHLSACVGESFYLFYILGNINLVQLDDRIPI